MRTERMATIGMRKVKRVFLWFVLMNKAVLKRVSFIFILGCIPLLAAGVNLMAEQDSGMLRIVLCQESQEDDAVSEIIEKLTGEDSIIQYINASSKEEAEGLVQSGKADAAWIFQEDFQEKLDQCMANNGRTVPFITIIVREDNPILNLSTIKLFSAIYEACSYSMYSQYITGELAGGLEIQPEELETYYRNNSYEGNLFTFKYWDGTAIETDVSYLSLPVRGMLALVIVLCGLASCMFFMQDEEKGVFTWLPVRKSLFLNLGYHIPVLLDAGIVVLLALSLNSGFSTWWWEILLMLLYLLAVTGFCDVVRRLCGGIVKLGALIPVLLIVMLAVCPIFMKAPDLKPVQFLLPPYYYLNAVHNINYLVGMVIYIVLVYLLDCLLLRWHPTGR